LVYLASDRRGDYILELFGCFGERPGIIDLADRRHFRAGSSPEGIASGVVHKDKLVKPDFISDDPWS
jgi:hypothetical protein